MRIFLLTFFMLLASGFIFNKNRDFDSAIQSIKDGNLESFTKSISGIDDINQKDQFGWTLLKYAVSHKRVEICQTLLNKGADIFLEDNNGMSIFSQIPDHILSNDERSKRYGFNVNSSDNASAEENDKLRKIYEMLKSHLEEMFLSEIKQSKKNGKLELILNCVLFDVNGGIGENKKSPLMFAVEELNANGASLILKKGGKFDARDKKDNNVYSYLYLNIDKKSTPAYQEMQKLLDETRKNRDVKAIRDAVKQGADLNWVNENGYTALMHASSRGKVLGCQLLLESGADLKAKDKNGKTAYDYIGSVKGKKEDLEVLRKLLKPD